MKKLIAAILLIISIAAFVPVRSNTTNVVNPDTTWKPYIIILSNEFGQKVSYWVNGHYPDTTGSYKNPVVLVGNNQTLPQGVYSGTLNGSSSYSPVGNTLTTFQWTLVSAGSVTIATPNAAATTFSNPQGDTSFTFKLTITDNKGNSASNTVTYSLYPIASNLYYISDSARFNFTPIAQNITGWTDVAGEPSKAVVTATSPSGWTISTVGTDSTLWNGDPNHADSSAIVVGQNYITPNDPYDYTGWDSAIVQTGFENFRSQYVPGTYNLKISGLTVGDKYKIQIIGSTSLTLSSASGNMYASRTAYTIGNTTKSLNTQWNTSSTITFDTLYPDASGNIMLNIAGQDSTYSAASPFGVISALKIYQISKTPYNGTNLISLAQHYYDTLMIPDGLRTREVNYYMPYNYSSSKKYGLIVYLNGQESGIANFNWDPSFNAAYGLGYVAEHDEGKIYGLDANGDTVSYFIIIPQYSINEWSGSYQGIDSLVTAFTNKYVSNYNDSLYVMGFSSGGAAALNYLYNYAYKVKGAYISSPASGGGYNNYPSNAMLTDTTAMFSTYGTHVFLSEHGDAFSGVQIALYDTINHYCPSCVYLRYFAQAHTAFTWEYTVNKQVDPVYEQTPYDFFANPSHASWADSVGYFAFRVTTAGTLLTGWGNVVNGFDNPSQGILSGTDSTLHATVSTVSTSSSLWNSQNGFTGTNIIYPDQLYNYYTNQYSDNGGINNTLKGTYASNGYNILVTGLQPNTVYKIWVKGVGYNLDSPPDTAVFYTPTDSVIVNQSAPIDQLLPVPLTETTDANGKLYLAMYARSGQAVLSYMIIRKLP